MSAPKREDKPPPKAKQLSNQDTIFFSYSRKDADEFALKLANDLRSAGANIWIDQLDIPPGKSWDEEIELALSSSKYILFIASEKSVISQNVLNEIYYAVDENKIVIPIKYHNCTIPFRIRRFQYIDFTGATGDYDRSLKRLITTFQLKIVNTEISPTKNSELKNIPTQIEEPKNFEHNQNLHTAPDISKETVNPPIQTFKSNSFDSVKKYWWILLIVIILIFYLVGKYSDPNSDLSHGSTVDSLAIDSIKLLADSTTVVRDSSHIYK